jgi:uncharacterized protein DUF3307
MLLFLQLYLAHLVADFLLQPNRIARRKTEIRPLVAHAAIHLVCAAAAVNLGLDRRVAGAIVGVALIHTLLDYGKARLSGDGLIAFAADQAAHLLVVALASIWLTGSWSAMIDIIRSLLTNPLVYLYGCAYAAVVFGGGYLIQKVTQSFLVSMQSSVTQLRPGLPNAGKYIGWVERILILTFIVGGYETAVGFLLAAKALVRYPEIKEDTRGHFAEYFLVGTLTSVGLALIAGMAVNKLKNLLG